MIRLRISIILLLIGHLSLSSLALHISKKEHVIRFVEENAWDEEKTSRYATTDSDDLRTESDWPRTTTHWDVSTTERDWTQTTTERDHQTTDSDWPRTTTHWDVSTTERDWTQTTTERDHQTTGRFTDETVPTTPSRKGIVVSLSASVRALLHIFGLD
ncbi:hypothetical protein FGIG_05829 [Fasciola gigantica]|uniref:Uncharacterized protein n=1 Tax=Fasciola gigantica TaxID=46835 RepID=A0A504XQN1_FASGI|nr:hypothetical protein FGIG_05829 [Fasciola gigantica]